MRRLLVLLLLTVAAPWPAPLAQEEADLGEAARLVVQRLEQAKAVFDQGEFARAIPLLGTLIDEIGAEPQAGLAVERRNVLLESLRMRGISHFNLGDTAAAERDFERLLRLDPRAELDARLVSPKVLAVFTKVRERATGTLAVRSTPPGAAVRVDGVEVGTTPLEPIRLAAGAHRLTLTRRDHANFEGSIEIAAGVNATQEAALVRNSRTLRFVSKPAGVRVTLDGQPVGTTAGEPEAVLVVPSVAIGDRLIRADKECHQPVEATVAVGLDGDPEQPLMVQPLVLPPSIGKLEITSLPSGASVTVDGVATGTTPTMLPTVCAGEHKVSLTRASAGSWSGAVRVVAGEQAYVRAELRLGLVSLGAAGFGADREDERNTWTGFVNDVVQKQTAYRPVAATDDFADLRWQLERHLLESSLGTAPLGEDLRRALAESTKADLALLAVRNVSGSVDFVLIRVADGRFDRLPARTTAEADQAEMVRAMSAGPQEPRLWTGIVAVDVPDGLMVLRASQARADSDPPRLGDRILTVEGQPVTGRQAFDTALMGREPGERVRIGIERSGSRKEVTLQVLASPNLEPSGSGGALPVKMTADLDRSRALAASEAEVGILGLRQAVAMLQAGDPQGAVKGFGNATALPEAGVGQGMAELVRGLSLEMTGEPGIAPARESYAAASKRPAATLWRDDGILIGPLAASLVPAAPPAAPPTSPPTAP